MKTIRDWICRRLGCGVGGSWVVVLTWRDDWGALIVRYYVDWTDAWVTLRNLTHAGYVVEVRKP